MAIISRKWLQIGPGPRAQGPGTRAQGSRAQGHGLGPGPTAQGPKAILWLYVSDFVDTYSVITCVLIVWHILCDYMCPDSDSYSVIIRVRTFFDTYVTWLLLTCILWLYMSWFCDTYYVIICVLVLLTHIMLLYVSWSRWHNFCVYMCPDFVHTYYVIICALMLLTHILRLHVSYFVDTYYVIRCVLMFADTFCNYMCPFFVDTYSVIICVHMFLTHMLWLYVSWCFWHILCDYMCPDFDTHSLTGEKSDSQ